MEEHAITENDSRELVDEIMDLVEKLDKDPENHVAAFLLEELASSLVRLNGNIVEVDFSAHQQPDTPSIERSEDDEQAPVKDPEVQRNKPFSIASFNGYPQGLSFMQMRQDINEWLIPEAEFDDYETAVEYLREQSFAGAVLRTDWDNGVGSIMLITQ